MEMLTKVNPDTIKLEHILFAATSQPDYDMSRTLILEDWPEYGSYAVARGFHCSCYDFRESDWDVTIYDKDELRKLMEGWVRDPIEQTLSAQVLQYLNQGGA